MLHELYKNFLIKNRYYIDFNGVDFTVISHKDNIVIFQATSKKEITAFIKGFNYDK